MNAHLEGTEDGEGPTLAAATRLKLHRQRAIGAQRSPAATLAEMIRSNTRGRLGLKREAAPLVVIHMWESHPYAWNFILRDRPFRYAVPNASISVA